MKSLKCFYANARSIVKSGKFDELRCIIQSLPSTVHIVILTETWIKSEYEAKSLQLPCYTHYFNFRHNNRGGGVSIFVHNNLKHNLIEDICIDDNHFLWVHVGKFCLDIGAVYKPERTNSESFLDTFSCQLHNRKRAVVFGDFNYDLLKKDSQTCRYKDTLKENGFKILNKLDSNYCTRETPTTKTILDHVSSSLKNNEFHFAVLDSAMSDHKQIFFEVKKFYPPAAKKVKYDAINYNKLYEILDKTINNTVNDDYINLEKNILISLNRCKEPKIKTMNPPRQDWINREVIGNINKRNILWQKYKKNIVDNKLKEEFQKQKLLVSKNIKETKKKYYYKIFKDCSKKPAKMWALINNLSNNKIKDPPAPTALHTDSRTITDTKEICECFNNFFATIGEKLANDIPDEHHNNQEPTQKSSKTELRELAPATTYEISKIIDNLKLNTSSGIDGINIKVLKCIKNLIIDDLTKCINKCLCEGIFPDSLKTAKVTPIYKSGSKTDPGNYRPISVLSVFSKIFEKVLYNRLDKYLTSIDFLYKKQYGFRAKSNTLSATIDLVTKIKVKIDEKQIVLGVFIDLKKAFDTVSHKILLKKLQNIGVVGRALQIFKSYLSGRSQIVKIGKYLSCPKNVNYGVPQGSILGPLLFLIYINNIQEIGLSADVTLYADDTSLFYFGDSINSIIPNLQSDLDLLNSWFRSNLLTINIAKTNYIIFAAKNKNIGDFTQPSINNEVINRKTAEKYLGIILDNSLNWKLHIDKIKNKITSLTGSLRNIVRCLPDKVRYLIYNSLVKPHIDYLIEVWGSAAKTNLSTVQTAQNKLIKVLFNYNVLTPTTKLYKNTNIMNINQTYTYRTCILIRKIINRDIHTNINFTKKSSFLKITLRNANNLILRPPRTNYGKKTIIFEGAQIYNKLPVDIKDSQSMSTFKRLLKFHVMNKV